LIGECDVTISRRDDKSSAAVKEEEKRKKKKKKRKGRVNDDRVFLCPGS
jgi:hypothetical protein